MTGYRSYQDDGTTGILGYHFPTRGAITRVNFLVSASRTLGTEEETELDRFLHYFRIHTLQ